MTKVEVGKIAAWIRKMSGVLLMAGAALALMRIPGLALIGLALMAGMIAYSIMARTGWYPGKGRGGPSATSAVRTPYLEMALDHPTGALSGRVLKGRFAGRALSDFTDAERLDLLGELRLNDAQGARLFEAYLDRAFPGWTASAEDSRTKGRAGPTLLLEQISKP